MATKFLNHMAASSVAMMIALSISTMAYSQSAEPAAASEQKMVLADDIPVAHTPLGGYGNSFPPPVLTTCTEPLVAGAPDLRGIWKAIKVERGGKPVPEGDPIHHYVERIEQCGNRIVDMGGGTIADGRADGTAKNGVHDIWVFDYKSPLHVVVSYEDGTYVLRGLLISMIMRYVPITIPYYWFPVTIPGRKVTRKLDEDGHMVWVRPDFGRQKVILERIGGPNDPYTRHDLPDSKSGGSGMH